MILELFLFVTSVLAQEGGPNKYTFVETERRLIITWTAIIGVLIALASVMMVLYMPVVG